MVAYVTYAEKFGWTPRQVDQLTIGQEDWLLPVLNTIEEQRSYNQQKAIEAEERKADAKRRRGFK